MYFNWINQNIVWLWYSATNNKNKVILVYYFYSNPYFFTFWSSIHSGFPYILYSDATTTNEFIICFLSHSFLQFHSSYSAPLKFPWESRGDRERVKGKCRVIHSHKKKNTYPLGYYRSVEDFIFSISSPDQLYFAWLFAAPHPVINRESGSRYHLVSFGGMQVVVETGVTGRGLPAHFHQY